MTKSEIEWVDRNTTYLCPSFVSTSQGVMVITSIDSECNRGVKEFSHPQSHDQPRRSTRHSNVLTKLTPTSYRRLNPGRPHTLICELCAARFYTYQKPRGISLPSLFQVSSSSTAIVVSSLGSANSKISMHLMYTLDANGKRIYTLKKVLASEVTKSAHPARFSPDDKYSRSVSSSSQNPQSLQVRNLGALELCESRFCG